MCFLIVYVPRARDVHECMRLERPRTSLSQDPFQSLAQKLQPFLTFVFDQAMMLVPALFPLLQVARTSPGVAAASATHAAAAVSASGATMADVDEGHGTDTD